MQEFLKRKNIDISLERYLFDAMSAMAMGLFSTLILGVVFETIGLQFNLPFFVDPLGVYAQEMSGAGIAVAVAMSLKAPSLVTYSSVVNGMVGSALGGPVGAYLGAIVGIEFGKAISKETSMDVILTPAVTILTGSTVGYLAGPPIDSVMNGIGDFVVRSTDLHPLLMGISIAVIMGILIVTPISSTAIVVMINLTGAASGATAVGCCAACIGFAVQSYRENGVKGLWAQIPGSPMLQVGNVFKNPLVLIPPSIAAAVVGALSTTLLPVTSIPEASGTGTSGFVAPIGIYADMTATGESPFLILFKIVVLCFVLPAIITWPISELLRKRNWIKAGDLSLDI